MKFFKDLENNIYLVLKEKYKKNNKWFQDSLFKDGLVRIKRNEYQELLNLFFSRTKETWEYQGDLFRNLDNFIVNSYDNVFHKNEYWCLNYQKLPTHKSDYSDFSYLVYYRGKLYTTNIQGNYFPRTILYPLNSKISSKIKWTNLKNCAPVFNITKKEIL